MKKNILSVIFLSNTFRQFLISITLFILLFSSCNTTEPPSNQTLTLKLEDVSCTEAWIQLTTTNLQLPATLNVIINNNVAQVFNLSTQDSLLYIDSLLPNQSYKFKVVANTTNNPQPTTNELTVTTMDTTSHNFTWQTFTFGDAGAGSSTLYDVAIIDENNIWAVGEIYMNDSLGNPDSKIYNAMHWNGSGWELKRIPILLNGTPFYPVIKSIFAFNGNDIWFEAGIHWDGLTFKQIPFNIQWNGNVNKMWGTSGNDLYAVGNNGNIAHWDGSQWAKIESGTTTSIKDIWGVHYDDLNSFILCAVTNVASSGDRKILRINNNNVSDFLWDTGRRVQSVWFQNYYFFYACGGGVFSLKKNNFWEEITAVPLYYTQEIRGNNLNDVMVVGDFGLLAHFNGLSWKVFSNPTADIYYSCALTSNRVLTVGSKADQAIIAIVNK